MVTDDEPGVATVPEIDVITLKGEANMSKGDEYGDEDSRVPQVHTFALLQVYAALHVSAVIPLHA